MNYTTLILTFILAGIFQYYTNRDKKKWNKKHKNEEALDFVNKIEQLGYFKYAKLEDIDRLKENFLDDWNPNNELVTIWNDAGIPLDYRYYSCDGEDVFEQGGLIEILDQLEPTFEKIKFKYSISDHYEEWDAENNWLNHNITINGTNYMIFNDYEGYGWDIAVFKLAEILNIEFGKQNINEKIYLASGGNDGRLVF